MKLAHNSLTVQLPITGLERVDVLQEDFLSADEINAAFATAAADASTRGVLEYSDEPLVSSDIVGNPASCIFSAQDTMVNGRIAKVLGWYDNEWGYSNRLVDLVEYIG